MTCLRNPLCSQKNRRRIAKSSCSTLWSIVFIVPIRYRSSGSLNGSTGVAADRGQVDLRVAVVERREGLAEQPAEVGAVDLVEDQHPRQRLGIRRRDARLADLVDQLQEVAAVGLGLAVLGDAEADHEVLVGVRLVQLPAAHLAAHELGDALAVAQVLDRAPAPDRLVADQPVGERLGLERLAGAGRAVEHDLLLVAQRVEMRQAAAPAARARPRPTSRAADGRSSRRRPAG